MQHCLVKPTTVLLMVTLLFCHVNMMASSKISYKCRIAINPYLDKSQCKKPYKKTCSQRTRVVTFAPSSITSDYNDRRSTIIIDRLSKKAYLIGIISNNTLELKPTKMYHTSSTNIRNSCTLKASPQNAHSDYYKSIEALGKNSKIRQKRIIRIRSSVFKSINNKDHTTELIDITARKLYFFWIDEEGQMHLHNITLNNIKQLFNPFSKESYNILDKGNQAPKKQRSSAATIKSIKDKLKDEFETYYKINPKSNYKLEN